MNTIFNYIYPNDDMRNSVLWILLSIPVLPLHIFHLHKDILYGNGIRLADLMDLVHHLPR